MSGTVEVSEELIFGSMVFFILLVTGVIGEISSAKWEITTSLFSTLLGMNLSFNPVSAIPVGVILLAILVVFITIPGTVGLFRLLTNN